MYWRHGNKMRASAMAVCTLAFLLASACARPQGDLFLKIDQKKVWPAPPGLPRIELIGALTSSDDLNAAKSGMEVFKATLRGRRPPIKFSGPSALALSQRGILAVADGAGACVHIIDLEERTHHRVTGWGEERFAVPAGVTWAGERLFVTDAHRRDVVELDTKGRVHGNFSIDEMKRPVGITFVPQRGQLYVVDGGAHCVRVFDLAGTPITTLGRQGLAPGEFNFPSHITSVGDRIVVADSGNVRIQWLDLDGRFVRAFGRRGDGAGDFSLPKGVAVDGHGHLYVVDARFENIQVFDSVGRLLMAWGREGRELGEFWLPSGLAIDKSNRIWVADSGNRRIQVFAYVGADS